MGAGIVIGVVVLLIPEGFVAVVGLGAGALNVDEAAAGVAHRLGVLVLEGNFAGDFFGAGLGGGGPPNPIEAKISSSVAPIKVFFLGLGATLAVFFGPRLVIPMDIPPIVPGSSCCCESGVASRRLPLEGGGAIGEDPSEMDDPPEVGATGFIRLGLLSEIPVLVLLPPLVLLEWKLEALVVLGLRTGGSFLSSSSSEGRLWCMLTSL